MWGQDSDMGTRQQAQTTQASEGCQRECRLTGDLLEVIEAVSSVPRGQTGHTLTDSGCNLSHTGVPSTNMCCLVP